MKLPKSYEPSQYEEKIYALWETSGAFRPSPKREKGKHYSIVMPPPNANGNLHIGHALTIGLEDIMTRYHRMKGDSTVYIPGADHAGFETWVVYEKALEKEGKSRFDFSREELYAQVWDFVEEHRGNMEVQIRQLGASCDWSHLVFTLDAEVIKTAYATFKQMWDDDLIYRGKRIVNYCTKHQTSFADIEVDHKTEKGKLWYINFPLQDGSGHIQIATTRPETMLGDVAVAVHPEDERYRAFVGRMVNLPLSDRQIPLIADTMVDKEFGSGAVKITPAHDPNDFEVVERHGLPRFNVIGLDGLITDEAPLAYHGLSVTEARAAVVANLETAGLIEKVEEHEHNVGHCYKCGTVIEPLLMDQWFIRMKPLAARAIKAIEAGDVTFMPASKGRELTNYLRELRDWNISRQIPWGIPIPAFQNEEDESDWIFDTRVDQPTIDVDGKTYRREEDTFDTWFSSGQWPFVVTQSAYGGELKDYYPTSLMETGVDLLRQWVARMIMLGLYRTGEVPFEHVYMHGMVLDEKGQKMSKSKGNVINPQEVIAEYGSDALRLGLIASRSAGMPQAFSTSKVVAGRNFANKLWNIARYIEGRAGDTPLEGHKPAPESLADHWIVRQLNSSVTEVAKLLEKHRFAESSEIVYHTIWNDVADWYIEASKKQVNLGMLAWVLRTSLRLTHPFAPFVTETIWQTLEWSGEGHEDLLINAAWPEKAAFDAEKAANFEKLQALITEARFVANELGKGKQTLLYTDDSLIEANSELIATLANLKSVDKADAARGLRLAVPQCEAWLDVSEETLYEHQEHLETRLADVKQRIMNLKKRLDNPNYVNQAPSRVVDETKNELTGQEELEERLARELEVLR